MGGCESAGQGDGRVWLDVPYVDRKRVALLGASWDFVARRYYIDEQVEPALFEAWRPLPPSGVFPTEDRTFGGSSLYVDLIPDSCFFVNVRSCVTRRDWQRLRRFVGDRVSWSCEICGARPSGSDGDYLDIHERWQYLDCGVQRLRRLIALCRGCHGATHFGFAELSGRRDEAMAQLQRVNGWDDAMALAHVDAAFGLWAERNEMLWVLDLTMIQEAGIRVVRPGEVAVDSGLLVD